jgi:hypothetical protein
VLSRIKIVGAEDRRRAYMLADLSHGIATIEKTARNRKKVKQIAQKREWHFFNNH